MLLKELFPNTNHNILITGIATDSRFVKPGFLFIPKSGKTFQGDEFYIEAIQNGAVAIISKVDLPHLPVITIIHPEPEHLILPLLQAFYQMPFQDLCLIGITGTDGKTTTATITSYLLESLHPSCYIGTNGIYLKNEIFPNLFTTPPLFENYRIMKECVDKQIHYCSMEVSSQGILNGRIESLRYDYAVFTNLSHEHLDTHLTMENYFQTKLQLFYQLKEKGKRIVNKDDSYAQYFDVFEDVIYFSIYQPSDYQAKHIRYQNGYTYFDLYTQNAIYENIKINRTEEYNIYNVIPGIIIALLEGLNIYDLYPLLEKLPLIPGRLEKLSLDLPFNVYIDFAHTPNALKAVLSSLKTQTKNRIIIVCGAAGKKDKTKRPLMGKIASEYADFVIFTSEDPRNENPSDIIKQMVSEITTSNYLCIEERKSAIDYAFQIAEEGDSIIVTGKGRETYFEIDGIIYPYSDYDYVLQHTK